MALSSVTQLGIKDGSGTDNLQLFLSKFGGEVYTTYKQKNTTEGYFLQETLQGFKETKERWTGDRVPKRFAPGTFLLSDSNALGISKFSELIVRVDADGPLYDAAVVHDFDKLLSPDGEMDRQRIAQKQGEAIAYGMDLTRLSTLIQTAAMPMPGVQPGTNPYETKATAGTAAGISNGAQGVDIVDLSSASGATIEDKLFNAQTYFDFLNMPSGPGDRICLIKPQLARKVVKDSGMANGISNTPSRSLNADLGGAGNGAYPRGTVDVIAGFSIVPSPHCNLFGTKLNNLFAPDTTKGAKYTPGSEALTSASTPPLLSVYGINGVTVPNSKIFDQGQGAGGPVDWNAAGVSVMDAFDKLQYICFVRKRSCKTNIVQGIIPNVSYEHGAFGWLLTSRVYFGHGAIDPVSVMYSVSAAAA